MEWIFGNLIFPITYLKANTKIDFISQIDVMFAFVWSMIIHLRPIFDDHDYFYAFILYFSICFVCITMFLVHWPVWHVEKETLQYTFAMYRKSKDIMEMSCRIMIQGMLYSATLVCQIIVFIVCYQTGLAIPLQNILLPLQGFFNTLMYIYDTSVQVKDGRELQSSATFSLKCQPIKVKNIS